MSTANTTTTSSLAWEKTGGHDQSHSIEYTSDRLGFVIYRSRISGSWSLPCLYQWDKFVKVFRTVAEAKAFAQNMGQNQEEKLP